MSKAYEFNAKVETQRIIDWIKEYFIKNGPDCNAIVGMSGGKDSTIVAALCAAALGPHRVIGVMMPQGNQHDIMSAYDAIDTLGIRSEEAINIASICDAFYNAVGREDCEKNSQITSNTPARVRMTILYMMASIYHGRVACTENYSESYVGYSTKFGDNAGDFAPLKSYTVGEVIQIGEVLGIPDELLHKIPEDGLSGLTDEQNLGFSYKTLDDYIRQDIKPDYDILKNIKERHDRNAHKNKEIPYCIRATLYPHGTYELPI